MYTMIIEVAAVILFAGCAWHAVKFEGSPFAQQWFVAGYLFGIIRETVMQVAFPNYFYAPSILRLGAAPALICLLWAALPYLAYVFARRIVPSRETVPFAALMFIAAASFDLPIEATAAQVRWWIYEPGYGPFFFGGVPLVVPLLWGGAAVLFFLFLQRVRASRLPERGRTYAMITFAPVLAALHVAYTLILNAVL